MAPEKGSGKPMAQHSRSADSIEDPRKGGATGVSFQKIIEFNRSRGKRLARIYLGVVFVNARRGTVGYS